MRMESSVPVSSVFQFPLSLFTWPVVAILAETISRAAEKDAEKISMRFPGSGTADTVSDVGVRVFGRRWHRWIFLPDLAQAAMVVQLLWSMRNLSAASCLAMLSRFAAVHSLLLTMRAVTIASTVTGVACPNYKTKGPHTRGLNRGCFDLMFSGHAAFGTLALIFAAHASPPSNAAIAALFAAAAIANSGLQVAVGDHYTNDVLVANFITVPCAILSLPVLPPN